MENINEQSIRGYDLHELLAQGGMGEVYRATQTVVGREVVVKKILPKYANQPEFIRRFEAEAKLVAQLDHLHIAPLYDYWRDPSGAYLIMRYLRGGTLRDSVRESGPWTPRATVRLLNQIGAALTVAHRRNVVHRDIKPANILLDDDQNAYLTDFGIALEMTESGDGSDSGSGPKAVSGSAGYISPEQINLQTLTPRADIYSMSLVIYEALTGHHPYPDAKSAIALFLKHVNEPLPAMPNYPQSVYDVLQKAAAKDPEDRYESMLEFASAFKKAIIDADLPAAVASDIEIEDFDTTSFELTASNTFEEVENPYKGLAAFQEGDADDFFGREQLIHNLLNRMDEEHPMKRFLAVVGPSGSGKSSVVKAGLLPTLRKGGLAGSEDWFIVEMIPGISPIRELEEALMRVAINPLPNLKEQLEEDSTSLAQVVDQALPDDGSELVVVIDQFEETFTTGSEKEREHFLQSLYQAIINPESRLRVVITLRADFYDRPLGIQNFSQLMQQRTEVVIPLTAEELERAITGPARRVKVFFQQGLAAQIVSEVNEQPGVLPMLQYALTELFARRDGPIIMAKDYQEIGGVLGALAKQAELMFNELDPEHQEATRQLFLRLVTLGEGTEDTRRRALQSEILSASSNRDIMRNVIDRFSKVRLLTTDRDPVTRSPTIEVAHEALIREWNRLRGWLDESREDVRLQRMLSSSATEWSENNNDDSFLLRGGRLVQFEDWIGGTSIALTELEKVFLDASIEERNRLEAEEEERQEKERLLQLSNQRRLRFIIIILGIAALGGILLTLAVFSQSQQAQFAAADALTQAALAATSEANANNNAATAVIAQDEAVNQANNAQTQAAIATIAQGDAIIQANNAQTQAAIATIAQGDAIIQANNAETQAAIATIAQGDAIIQANNAQTQAAIATIAQGDAENSQNEAVLQANNAGTQAAIATFAQGQAQIEADNARQAELEAQILADQAQSLALASFALQFSESDSPLALALALEANSIDNPPLQAQQVLISVVYEGPRKFFEAQAGILDIDVLQLPLADDAEISTGLDETLDFVIFTAHENGSISQWDLATNEVLMQFVSHTGAVNSIDISPSGSQLASGSEDGRVILWNIETGEVIRDFLGHSGAINSVDFNSDGTRLVTGSDDGSAIVWDVNSGSITRTLSTAGGNPVNSVKFNPSGNNLLVITDDAMRIWRFDTGEFLEFGFGDNGRLREGEETNRIRNAEFSNDGTFIVTTGSAGTSSAEIWDTQERRLLRRLPEHNGLINSVAISQDDKFVLSASDDFTVILSSVASGDIIRSYLGHQNRVNDAVFADDDERVVSASSDGEMYLWDKLPVSRSYQALAGYSNGVDSIVKVPYNPDLFLSTSADGDISLWDGITGEQVKNFRQNNVNLPQNKLDVSPIATEDDLIVAIANRTIQIRNFANDAVLQQFVLNPIDEFAVVNDVNIVDSWFNSVAFSPDGSQLLSGGGYFVRSEIDRESFTAYPLLHLWDVETGELIRQYNAVDFVINDGYNAPITAVEWSPDGDEIVSGVEDGRIVVWSATSGTISREFSGHSDRITAIKFSPDGSQIVTSSNDRLIILWDYESGRLLRRFTEHRGAVNDVEFNENGSRILSGAEDTRVILWDATTGNFVQRFSEQDTPITSVTFIKDGMLAVSGALDGSLVLREIDTAQGLIDWARDNRFVPILTCEERQQFNLDCDENQVNSDADPSTG